MLFNIFLKNRDLHDSIPVDPSVAKLKEVSSTDKESTFGVDISNKEYTEE